jgi:hypothetical protein
MEKTYIISWKRKSHAASGRSKGVFTREEAERLAEELNRDYPDIIHEPVNLHAPPPASAEPKMSTNGPEIVRDLTFASAPLPIAEAAMA